MFKGDFINYYLHLTLLHNLSRNGVLNALSFKLSLENDRSVLVSKSYLLQVTVFRDCHFLFSALHLSLPATVITSDFAVSIRYFHKRKVVTNHMQFSSCSS